MTQRSVTHRPVTTRVTDPRTLNPFTFRYLGSQGTCMYKLCTSRKFIEAFGPPSDILISFWNNFHSYCFPLLPLFFEFVIILFHIPSVGTPPSPGLRPVIIKKIVANTPVIPTRRMARARLGKGRYGQMRWRISLRGVGNPGSLFRPTPTFLLICLRVHRPPVPSVSFHEISHLWWLSAPSRILPHHEMFTARFKRKTSSFQNYSPPSSKHLDSISHLGAVYFWPCQRVP
jgi:hypothetical protein